VTEDKRVPLEEGFANALGVFFDTRPPVRDIVSKLVDIARLPDALSWERREVTSAALVRLVLEVQEATWDKRVSLRDRPGIIARTACPSDYAACLGVALDFGMGRQDISGGSVLDVGRDVQGLVRRRLEKVARDLLVHVAESLSVELAGQ
jgi:hypothetical protein